MDECRSEEGGDGQEESIPLQKRWKKLGKEDKKEYIRLENKTKSLIRNRKNALERKIARESKTNPKSFFSYINSARKNRNSIGSLKIDDKLVVNPKDQSSTLNHYFSSIFTTITRCKDELPTKEPHWFCFVGKCENV